jgi:hypothetical protein
MEPYGYVTDGGELALEGFTISFSGRDGAFELHPKNLLHPEIGCDPGNIMRVTVRLRAGLFGAEHDFDFLWSAFQQLSANLDEWLAGQSDQLTFPSPAAAVLIGDLCCCAIERERLIAQCELSCSNEQSRRTLTAEFRINADSVSRARGELAKLALTCDQARGNR